MKISLAFFCFFNQTKINMTLNNTTALITGGNTGIGFGIAAALAEEGVNVAITSRTLKKQKKRLKKSEKILKLKVSYCP